MSRIRLSRFVLPLLAAAFSVALAQAGNTNPNAEKDLAELQRYQLTLDNVTRFYQAQADFDAARQDPAVAKSLQADPADPNDSLDQMEHRIAAIPALTAVLARHKFTPREYAVITISLLQVAFAEAAKEAGADPAKLAAESHVNPANLAFYEQHKADIEALEKKYATKESPADNSQN